MEIYDDYNHKKAICWQYHNYEKNILWGSSTLVEKKGFPDLTVTGLIFQFSNKETYGHLQHTSYSNSGIHFPYFKASLQARI